MKQEFKNPIHVSENSEQDVMAIFEEGIKVPEAVFKKDLKKVFGPADLWKVHRQRRNVRVRRYY